MFSFFSSKPAFSSGPKVSISSPPSTKTPLSLDPQNSVMTGEQLIYVLVKFMHITRDFSDKCDTKFYRCSKSRNLFYKFFGKGSTLEACVAKSYASATYTYQQKGKKPVTHTVSFSKEEQKLVKLLCEYKRQFDGYGDDPKCVQVADSEMKALSKKNK